MARLGDICTVNPKIPNLDDRLRVSFVPMNKITENGEIDSSECRTFLEVKKGFTYFQNNDILFPKITPCMENGKGALAISLKNGIGFGSTEFHVLRPIPTVAYGKWLYYVTVWDVFRKECEKHMTGSAGQKRVPKAFIENFELQVPSLEQQYHIVTVLDKVSNLIFLRKQQLAKLDELVKARFVEMFGDPVKSDRGWPTVPLGEIADVRIGPFGSMLHKDDYIEKGHALVNPSHIIDGKIVIDPKLTISDEKYFELSSYALQPGDVVLGRRGEMGRCAVACVEGLLCGTGSMIIRSKGEMLPYFLQNILSSPGYKKIIEDKAVGVTMLNLNVPIVSSLEVPLLPIEAQNRYICFLEKIDEMKLTILQGLDKLEMLKKALMQEYFGN